MLGSLALTAKVPSCLPSTIRVLPWISGDTLVALESTGFESGFSIRGHIPEANSNTLLQFPVVVNFQT